MFVVVICDKYHIFEDEANIIDKRNNTQDIVRENAYLNEGLDY